MAMERYRTQPTILVVEDYADSRAMLKLLLESQGYSVFTASDGREALTIAGRENIDLVLTDFGLPDINGVSLVRQLRRKNEHLNRIPIIMLTAFDAKEYQGSATQAGCTDFLIKPPDYDKLEKIIEFSLRKNDREQSRVEA